MKKVHIISHSHWDREWYLSFERHRMLLVELIDDVLELFENDPDFKYFHLDGQTILLDDYLEIKPDKKPLLEKYIQNGQMQIGPFYILQDAYLTSSESNVRNMLIGHQESTKWGNKVEVGYYPDTFGNVGQTPQLMKQLGFTTAAFGRGVKPTGFANQSNEKVNYESSFSEMHWEGADGSNILGLLFANWYSNGNEIPAEKEAAMKYWDKKLSEAEQFASTNQLLFLNGVDHQPVQKDVTKAIKLANELYPNYEFVHSNFTDYLNDLHQGLPEDLDTVEGELTSQKTEGWYTLTNTASARTYLKQENHETSVLLEQIAEPLATMAAEVTGKYPHEELEYAWKTYMQNHPHDSICGCSIDEVHAEMMTRFQKAKNVGQYIVDEALADLTEHMDTNLTENQEAVPFVVFNTAGAEKSGVATVEFFVDNILFDEELPPSSFDKVQNQATKAYTVINSTGTKVDAVITDEGAQFIYDLPKDGFRVPQIARKLIIEVAVEALPSFAWETFYLLVEAEDQDLPGETFVSDDLTLVNDWLSVEIDEDGTVTVTDLETDKTYSDLLVFEDVGDIGNEYVFKQPNNEAPIYSRNKLVEAKVSAENSLYKELTLIHEIDIPVSADEQLDYEQKAVIEFRNRKAQRVAETKPLRIETKVTLEKESKHLSFSTTLTNDMKDHRLRVLFPTSLQANVHYADSIFETVERPNKVSKEWTNPTNPQRTHRFINLHDDKNGMILAPEGLNEYEVVEEDNQQTIAITLLRAVGEMGDWGYFPTPEAQCLDTYTFNYALSFHGSEDRNTKLKEATQITIPFSTTQTTQHEGTLQAKAQFLDVQGENILVTALKRNKETNEPVTRFYNFTPDVTEVHFKMENYQPIVSNILEEKLDSSYDIKEVKPFEIKTYLWKADHSVSK